MAAKNLSNPLVKRGTVLEEKLEAQKFSKEEGQKTWGPPKRKIPVKPYPLSLKNVFVFLKPTPGRNQLLGGNFPKILPFCPQPSNSAKK